MPDGSTLDAALARIRSRATEHDLRAVWPADDLADLAESGALRWAVPAEYGGEGRPALDVTLLQEKVAAASLATGLVLSQRDSAIALIAGCANEELKRDLLPRLAANEIFATIGIAQLTTSRQGREPAVRAAADGDGFVLDGTIPWSTGAGEADFIITGAALPDGRQILAAVPVESPGADPHPPMPLVAMRSSRTAAANLKNVRLTPWHLLAGPVENVLAGRAKPVPLNQSYLATGHVRAALELIAAHDSEAGREAFASLAAQLEKVRSRLLGFQEDPSKLQAGPELRAASAELALRAANAAVALFKGGALLENHPAQRLAREAMFLLVWSCPTPVINQTVRALAGPR